MKSVFSAFALAAVSAPAFATINAEGIDGKVFYKLKTGELVKREVALSKNAEGKIQLTAGDKTVEAAAFYKQSYGAGVKSVIVFPAGDKKEGKPGAFGHKGKWLVFKGVKLNGTNKKAFWGKLYSVTPKKGHNMDANTIGNIEIAGGNHKGVKKHFFGGFSFVKLADQGE